MKKLVLSILGGMCMLLPVVMNAQSFSPAHDTVKLNINSTGGVADNVTNLTGANLNLSWHVDTTNFPKDWLTPTALGLCDASVCRGNNSNLLWDDASKSGSSFSCIYGANSAHDSVSAFSITLDLTDATTNGTYYLTVSLSDGSTTSKKITFQVNKGPLGIPAMNTGDKTMLYPNPATSEVNVVYDANAGVKNIAIYNIIGKVMNVYKVTDNNSANLDIANLPSGIYLLKLYNASGNALVTRKFTKQ